ncbi:MAG: hypothetical protein D6744_12600 [Planctomycetota bacterium]|nr:MAG: hypothetical protein D6744_12600 [Planctomycetota bacterium]
MINRFQTFGSLCVAAALLGAVGCTNAFSLFNPDFVQALGLSSRAASLPGEAPSIVIGVRNDTSRTVEFLMTWRNDEGDVFQSSPVVGSEQEVLLSEFCPITEITLGDVSDLSATGAVVRLGAGGLDDAFVEVEPFGVLLQSGIHFDCGDRVVFSVRASTETLSGYRVFAEIQRSGAQTSDTVDSADTSNGGDTTTP